MSFPSRFVDSGHAYFLFRFFSCEFFSAAVAEFSDLVYLFLFVCTVQEVALFSSFSCLFCSCALCRVSRSMWVFRSFLLRVGFHRFFGCPRFEGNVRLTPQNLFDAGSFVLFLGVMAQVTQLFRFSCFLTWTQFPVSCHVSEYFSSLVVRGASPMFSFSVVRILDFLEKVYPSRPFFFYDDAGSGGCFPFPSSLDGCFIRLMLALF